MNELLARVIEAHGGMDRWNGYEKVEATIVSGVTLLRSRACCRIRTLAA